MLPAFTKASIYVDTTAIPIQNDAVKRSPILSYRNPVRNFALTRIIMPNDINPKTRL